MKIIACIDLLLIDHNMDALREKLQSIRKDHYDADEKIAIVHEDIEYFYHKHITGFTTHNLLTIIKQVDISLSVFVFVSSNQNFKKSIEPFIDNLDDQPTVRYALVTSLVMSAGHLDQLLSQDFTKSIAHPAMCLLGTPRNHKTKLYQFIKHAGLSNINFTYNSPQSATSSRIGRNQSSQSSVVLASQTNDMVYSIPHRFNDTWLHYTHKLDYLNHIKPRPTLNDHITSTGFDFYRDHFVDIVAETVFDYPQPFISEKTIRPMATLTPMVVFGAAGHLKSLQQHGFKTFHDFWDESYDNIDDPGERFQKCADLLVCINDWDINTCQEMYEKMLPILTHNKQHLSNYIDTVYEPLYNSIQWSNHV